MSNAAGPGAIRFAADVEVVTGSDGRTLLLGGSPLRMMRLTEAGARWVGDGTGIRSITPGAVDRLAWRMIDAGIAVPVIDAIPAEADEGWGRAGDLTVVIPVRDRADELHAALAALALDAEAPRIVIVDDASDDPDAVAAVAAAHGASVVRLATNGGPAAARNAGLAHVDTPLVAFLDSDVVASPGWWRPLVALCRLDRVAVAAPRVAAAAQRGTRGQRYEAMSSPLDLGPIAAPIAPGSRVAYVPAAALVARSDALRSVGAFDVSLRFGEDVDLWWRLADAGWRLRYEPAVIVHHRVRPTAREAWRQRVGYGGSAAALDRRHPRSVPAVRLTTRTAASAGALVASPPLGALATALAVADSARGLRTAGLPGASAARRATGAHVAQIDAAIRALIRPWWPLTVALCAASRLARSSHGHRSLHGAGSRGRASSTHSAGSSHGAHSALRRLAVAIAAQRLVSWRRAARRATGSATGRAAPGTRPLDPVTWSVLSVADDVAYSVGVWRGVVRERRLGPLAAELRN
jgi:mycofactocin system glycosyltransferase